MYQKLEVGGQIQGNNQSMCINVSKTGGGGSNSRSQPINMYKCIKNWRWGVKFKVTTNQYVEMYQKLKVGGQIQGHNQSICINVSKTEGGGQIQGYNQPICINVSKTEGGGQIQGYNHSICIKV